MSHRLLNPMQFVLCLCVENGGGVCYGLGQIIIIIFIVVVILVEVIVGFLISGYSYSYLSSGNSVFYQCVSVLTMPFYLEVRGITFTLSPCRSDAGGGSHKGSVRQ